MAIRLHEILDLPLLQGMLQDLWKANGLPLGLLDNRGQLLVAIGWQPVCTEFHRQHPELASRCLLNCPELLQAEPDSRQPKEILCGSGLIDLLLPIRCGEELAGWLMFGQFLDAPPEPARFREQALQLGCDPEDYLRLIEAVPVVSREKVNAYLQFCQKLLDLLCEAGLHKLREAQARESLLDSQRALHESEERFRGIVQATPLGIHMYQVEPDGRLVFTGYNPAADSILKVNNRKFLGKELCEAFPALAGTEVPERYRQVCMTGEPWQAEQVSYADGEITGAFEVHAFRTGINQMASVFMDIGSRLMALEKIRASEATLRSILAAAPLSIGLGHERTFSWVNRWMLEMLGYREKELIGRNARILYESDAEYERVGQVRAETVDRGKMGEVETRWVCCDGEVIDILLRFTRIDPDNPAPGVIFTALNITEAKCAATELRQREERIRLLLESSGEAIYGVDADGRCTFVNPMCLELLGYHHERELLGRRLYDVVHCAPAEDRLGCEEECRIFKALRNGEAVHVVGEQFWRSDGGGFPVEYWSSPMLQDGKVVGAVVNFIDVTERLQAEQRLRDALIASQQVQEQINTILRSVADALILIDPRGSVRMANPAACDLLGVDAEQVSGRQIAELLPDEYFLNQVGKAITGNESSHPFDLGPCPKGGGRVLQARLATIREEGQTLFGVVASLRDVTREREVERLKDDFISTAAHELRTPITAILGYAEIMLDQLPSLTQEQLHQYLGVVCNRADALTQIVGEMLDLSRMQSGQVISLNRQPGDFGAMIRELFDHYCMANDSHVVRLHIGGALPVIAFDAAKLRQVFDNLLSNAFKFSSPGSQVVITVTEETAEVLVTVKDDGVGMSPDQVERIFDKFYRADSSASAISGLGLGMSLVKGIIEGHGGRIWVNSAPGNGTSVSFTLPLGSRNGS